MRKLMITLMLICVSLVLGCQENQQERPVWGQGDPPDTWQEQFGNENMARLNFVQTDRINKLGQAMAESSIKIMELTERVKLLEVADSNDAWREYDRKRTENSEERP